MPAVIWDNVEARNLVIICHEVCPRYLLLIFQAPAQEQAVVRVKRATGFGNSGSWVQYRVKEIARTRWSRVGAFEAWASSTGTPVGPTLLRSQGQPSENFSKPLRPINHTHLQPKAQALNPRTKVVATRTRCWNGVAQHSAELSAWRVMSVNAQR